MVKSDKTTVMLTQEQVMRLHKRMIAVTGGAAQLREEGLLQSALSAPFATFFDQELYPSVQEKAARLGHSLIANHAFADGNKRIGLFAMLVFLRLNGIELCLTDQDVIDAGLSTAAGSMGYDALLEWIRTHEQGER